MDHLNVHSCAYCLPQDVFAKAAPTSQTLMEDDSWEAWNRLRNLCEANPKLGVALELTADLPSWPVRHVCLVWQHEMSIHFL
jgi:hypothetical protein